ncbi:F390 synthetase-related protein [Legionella sp. PATHC039]|uniref:F390 synthetase-related protein n=1 Tax=Legionella sp. PATHC039 TaxID=2992042 RepID=UPI0022435285|nr:F390 synthetase-related protein [Legionella sp. PATHC039]MCW8394903.1 CoF synthetase [Legionella sp. PATHC039]
MLARILFHYFNTLYLNKTITTPEKLKTHQAKQFKKLIKNCLHQSAFYRDYLKTPLEQWPIVNKKIMMEHFDDVNTVNVKKTEALEIALRAEHTRDFSPMINNIAIGLSSGTSGSRGLFLVSEQERDAWAGIILAKAMPNGLRSRERIAFFLRANNQLYTTLNKSRTIQFHFFDLFADFDTHIQRLNAIQPTIISAPASVLLMLASHQDILKITPKKIFSVAEVLEPKEEEILTKAFGCTISQIYQCTEGFLAISERKTNRLLMNEEFLIIEKEWLDEERFVPIITDLYRSTQPIIRYRLDDILVVERSNGVFTELKNIEGRLGDVCYGKRGQEIVPIFADVIRQHMISSGVNFEDYLICQQTLTQFTIQISPEISNKNQFIEHLNQLFIYKNCELPQWNWELYDKNKPGVKRRRVRSLYCPKTE